MGLLGQINSTDQIPCLVSVDLRCILLSPSCFSLPYPHSNLYTKTPGSYMQISYSQTSGISLSCSCLLDPPSTPIHSFSVGYLSACGYDLDTPLLRLFLHLSTGITSAISLVLPSVSLHKTLSSDISGQILCGTYNSTSYVLNYVCLHFVVLTLCDLPSTVALAKLAGSALAYHTRVYFFTA